MSNVVILPVVKRDIPLEEAVLPSPSLPNSSRLFILGGVLFSQLFNFLRICLVLVWPLAARIFAVDVSFQFFRAAFRWHSFGWPASVPFICHFLVFAALTLVVHSAAKK